MFWGKWVGSAEGSSSLDWSIEFLREEEARSFLPCSLAQAARQPQAKISSISRACGHLGHIFLTLPFLPSRSSLGVQRWAWFKKQGVFFVLFSVFPLRAYCVPGTVSGTFFFLIRIHTKSTKEDIITSIVQQRGTVWGNVTSPHTVQLESAEPDSKLTHWWCLWERDCNVG